MKTKDEIKKWLLANAVDEFGEVDLSGIDFGDYGVNCSGLKATVIFNGGQKAEMIFNEYQKADTIFNDCQKAGEIYNSGQEGVMIDNDNQKMELIERIKELKNNNE